MNAIILRMASPRNLILDCDPGVDDAVALFLAFAAPDVLGLLGITTVAGNVGPGLTARNARLIRQLSRRPDVPIYAGCTRPMVRPPVEASHFHGESGLGNLSIFEPDAPLAAMHAVQFIVTTLLTEPAGSVDLLITGPMTNVAMAMVLEPRIVPRIRDIVFMGGARSEGGNITASAEYNIYADPHAAHVVCSSGCRIVALGLDATHQVRGTAARIDRIRRLPGDAAGAVVNLLEFCNSLEANLVTGAGSPLHDPCTVAYAMQPSLFTTRPCYLRIETQSELTLGHTAVEFRPEPNRAMTTHWATHADADAVFDLLTERLARL